MNIYRIIIIANNDISKIFNNYIFIFTFILCVLFAFINIAGFFVYISTCSDNYTYSQIFFIMIQNFSISLFSIFSFLSMSIAVTTLAEERSNGALAVLSSKPVKRVDILLGKYIGMNIFLCIFSLFIIVLFVSLMIAFGGMPEPIIDSLIRVISLIVLMWLNVCISVGIITLMIMLFKNFIESLIASLLFIILMWFMRTTLIFNYIDWFRLINPSELLIKIKFIGPTLFDLSFPYEFWFLNALPYIIFLILEIIIVYLISCILFIKEDF